MKLKIPLHSLALRLDDGTSIAPLKFCRVSVTISLHFSNFSFAFAGPSEIDNMSSL
jgi:hypothetical protein